MVLKLLTWWKVTWCLCLTSPFHSHFLQRCRSIQHRFTNMKSQCYNYVLRMGKCFEFISKTPLWYFSFVTLIHAVRFWINKISLPEYSFLPNLAAVIIQIPLQLMPKVHITLMNITTTLWSWHGYCFKGYSFKSYHITFAKICIWHWILEQGVHLCISSAGELFLDQLLLWVLLQMYSLIFPWPIHCCYSLSFIHSKTFEILS